MLRRASPPLRKQRIVFSKILYEIDTGGWNGSRPLLCCRIVSCTNDPKDSKKYTHTFTTFCIKHDEMTPNFKKEDAVPCRARLCCTRSAVARR